MLRKFHCGDGENLLKTIRFVQLKCFPTIVNYVKMQLQFVCILWVNPSASHSELLNDCDTHTFYRSHKTEHSKKP